MKKINIPQIGSVVVIFLVIMFFLQKCNNDKYQQLIGERNVLKEALDNKVSEIDSLEILRKKEKDSVNRLMTERANERILIEKENTSLKKQINKIKKEVISVPTTVDSSVVYFNNRYNTVENIVIEDKVGLGISTSVEIITDLEEGDNAKEILPILEEVNTNQEKIIESQAKDKADLGTMLNSAEEEIKKREELQDLAEKNINSLENQVRQQKKKNFWNKVLIGVGTVGGFLLGKGL